MRLCGNYVPDVQRITACMHAKRSQLSRAAAPCSAARKRRQRRAATTDRRADAIDSISNVHPRHDRPRCLADPSERLIGIVSCRLRIYRL